MLSLTIVGARLAQFLCAMILLGSPLFFLYGLPRQGPGAARALAWPRPLLFGAAVVLAVVTSVSLCAQTAMMSGAVSDAFSPDALQDVVTDTQFGLVTVGRLGLTMVLVILLAAARPSRALWIAASVLGAGIVASFAWTGHGATDEGVPGWVHLTSDVLHLLAAAVWLGALAAFAALLWRSRRAKTPQELRTLHRALEGFSGIGSGVVAVILATGLVNSWFLVGPSHLAGLLSDPYGQLLAAKVALFVVMLGLAAANRFRLTPHLRTALDGGAPTAGALAALRRSVLVESLLGLAVLGLVSLLGTLAPLTSQ
ncbi:MAG TPA: copper homeostasis membrane protein CopD [Caulobacteraceae bacterium]